MDEGLNKSLWLAISVVAAAALISIIIFTVSIGNQVKYESMSLFGSIHNAIADGYIKDIALGELDMEMPAATAYSILTTYSGTITTSVNARTGRIVDLQVSPTDLMDGLGGRVQLEFGKVINGNFYVIIHDEDCMWETGFCTCAFAATANNFKNTYGVE